MHLREGRLEDLPYLADIASEALWDDEIVHYLAPHRWRYPHSHRDNYLYRTRKRYFQGDRLVLVVTDQEDESWSGKEIIAGFAFWSNTLATYTKRSLPTSFLGNSFEQSVLRVEGTYRWYMNIDRSYDKTRFAKFWAILTRYPFFEDIADYWELEILAVRPAFQRQGLGSILLTWGMNQASLHQLPVVVAATFSGECLYRKHGFEECGRIDVKESEFSWAAMVWSPPLKT